MDFDFSDEQLQLRDAVRKWTDKAYTFERRRETVAQGGFSPDVWRELTELGLPGLVVGEQHGGMGMGPVDAMVVMEELGQALVLEPLAHSYLCSVVMQHHASPALQGHWLAQVASGEALLVLAHQERQARYQLNQCTTQAVRQGDNWRVSGHKNLVPVGDLAHAYVVSAMAGEHLVLLLVERQQAGVSSRGHSAQDGSRMAEVGFQQASAQLLCEQGQDALQLALDVGVAQLCAQAVGVMDKTLALTVAYMNTRQQFGVPIANFQALRHRVADMKMQLELARSMSYYASLKISAPAPERRRAMARAKVQLGQSMRFVGQQAVQLHGGMGVTDEMLVSHCFKKLTQMELTFGDTLHHLGQVSELMQDSAGVFA